MKDLDFLSPFVTYLELEVVCNFKRERLRFHEVRQNMISIKANIIMNNPEGSGYFFNNLNIFSNYDFYFDYTSTDNCFLYYNLANMQCIKAKEGYILLGGAAVEKNKCLSGSIATQAMTYNPYTMECMPLDFIIQGCKTYTDDLSGCAECFDSNMSSNDCTVCNQGFFKETDTSECKGRPNFDLWNI